MAWVRIEERLSPFDSSVKLLIVFYFEWVMLLFFYEVNGTTTHRRCFEIHPLPFPPPPYQQHQRRTIATATPTESPSRSPTWSPSPFKLSFSPGGGSPIMDSFGVGVNGGGSFGFCSSNYSKFNFALNTGFLKPMSPLPLFDKSR